ncbi:MATE family efflux transporter [Natronobiforma cellulositropha]|uniref:MATE family efflux transporter n=1 Tax=Natronobiforma cellulositropha TaxID=1679076 RepID=UPI0021D5C6A5|nr:MATE family efflux transporter [Natronobiforma cellulositropha]
MSRGELTRALGDRRRTFAEWKRFVRLGWPISVQSFVRTGMRTTDVLVAGLFGPAAIAALGLSNLYTRLALFTGIGIGTGSLALTSQDTGSGADANRDQAVTQALLLGFLIGIPFALFAFLFSEQALALFAPPAEVIETGAPYLLLVLGTAPFRHIVLIGEKSMQGTGDTMTPMYIRGGANVVNIIGTVTLGLGLGPAPQLEVVGIGLATAGSNVLAAVAVILVFTTGWSDVNLVRPTDLTIAKQIVAISIPRTVEGFSTTAASFPLEAILVAFSVEVYAAYTVGQTVRSQLTGPFARSYGVLGSILTGQAIGEKRIRDAHFSTAALTLFCCLTIGILSLTMLVGNEFFASIFSDDATTAEAARTFIVVFAIAAPLEALFRSYSGILQGAGETTKPFIAEITGVFGLLLGITYVGGIVLGGGVVFVYLAIVAYNVWRFGLIYFWYNQEFWIENALHHLEVRGSLESD